MALNAQQQLLLDELRRLHRSASRRNDEAAVELRAAESQDDWNRVLKCHLRKMRAAGEQDVLVGAMDLTDSGVSIQLVVAELESVVPRSRATLLTTVRRGNEKSVQGRLAHDLRPPQFDQDWSNVSFALGQELMLTHIVNFAKYAAQAPPRGGIGHSYSAPAEVPWAQVQPRIQDEVRRLIEIRDSVADQERDWRERRRSALQHRDEKLVDVATDRLHNLSGQIEVMDEILRIACRDSLETSASREAAAEDLNELNAFSQVQVSAWHHVFWEAIEAKDVLRSESANKFLNRANGWRVMVDWGTSLSSTLRDPLG